MQAHVSILLALLCLGAFNGTLAQPGDIMFRYRPCRMIADELIDLNKDGLADLQVVGRQEGTDDVPSSHGWCIRSVRCVNGTRFLHMAERTRPGAPTSFAEHDTLPDPGLENDHMLPRHQWVDGEVTALRWPYGTAVNEPNLEPLDADRPVYVARLPGKDGDLLVALRIELYESSQQVVISTRSTSREAEDLRW